MPLAPACGASALSAFRLSSLACVYKLVSLVRAFCYLFRQSRRVCVASVWRQHRQNPVQMASAAASCLCHDTAAMRSPASMETSRAVLSAFLIAFSMRGKSACGVYMKPSIARFVRARCTTSTARYFVVFTRRNAIAGSSDRDTQQVLPTKSCFFSSFLVSLVALLRCF